MMKLLIAFCLIPGFLVPSVYAESFPAVEELFKMEKSVSLTENVVYNVEQIENKVGKKRKLFKYKYLISLNGKKQEIIFTKPFKNKLEKIIINEDKVSFLKSNDKNAQYRTVKNIRTKIYGSLLTYEDLLCGSYCYLLKGRVIRKVKLHGKEFYVLNLRTTYRGSRYTRIIMWIDIKSKMRNRMDFYKRYESTPFKRMLFKNIKILDGKKYHTSISIINLENGNRVWQKLKIMK